MTKSQINYSDALTKISKALVTARWAKHITKSQEEKRRLASSIICLEDSLSRLLEDG